MTGFSILFMLVSLSVIPCSVQEQIPFAPKNIVAAIEDVPFIRCDVCRTALKYIKLQVEELRSKKGKKVCTNYL